MLTTTLWGSRLLTIVILVYLYNYSISTFNFSISLYCCVKSQLLFVFLGVALFNSIFETTLASSSETDFLEFLLLIKKNKGWNWIYHFQFCYFVLEFLRFYLLIWQVSCSLCNHHLSFVHVCLYYCVQATVFKACVSNFSDHVSMLHEFTHQLFGQSWVLFAY